MFLPPSLRPSLSLTEQTVMRFEVEEMMYAIEGSLSPLLFPRGRMPNGGKAETNPIRVVIS